MGEKRGMKALEAWCRRVTAGYRDVQVSDMSTSWRDGLAFCAIVHHFRPDLIDFDSLSKENIFYNNNLAFTVAEQQLGIAALLDAEDMVAYKVPDRLSILTYVSQLYQHFHTMEAPSRKGPAKRSLTDDKTETLAESPGKRSAVNVSSVPSPASGSVLTRNHEVCHVCHQRVYILERLIVENKLYHRTCLKCSKCHRVLSLGSYVESDKPEEYECMQCPAKAPAPKMASNSHPNRVITPAPSKLVTPSTEVRTRDSATETGSVRRSLFPSRPDAGVSLEIALAAAKARSQFHSRFMTEEPDHVAQPVTDTGQVAQSGQDGNSVSKDSNLDDVVLMPKVAVLDHISTEPQHVMAVSKVPYLPASETSGVEVAVSSTLMAAQLPRSSFGKSPRVFLKDTARDVADIAAIEPSKIPANEPPKLTAGVPPKLPASEQPKLPGGELPKLTSSEPPKLPSSEPPKLPGSERSQLPGSEPSKLPGSEPSKLPGSEPSKLPGSEPSKLPGSEPSKLPGSEPSKLPGSEPSKLPGSEPPKLPGSEPPKLPGSEPPKLPGSEPPKLPGSEPSMLLGSEPPKLLGSEPSKLAGIGVHKLPEIKPQQLPDSEPSKPVFSQNSLVKDSTKSCHEQLVPGKDAVDKRLPDRPILPAKPNQLPERPHTLALRSSFHPASSIRSTKTTEAIVPPTAVTDSRRSSEELGTGTVVPSNQASENQDGPSIQDAKSVPVAAPRASRSKRQSKVIPLAGHHVPKEVIPSKPVEASEESLPPKTAEALPISEMGTAAVPVPKKRTSILPSNLTEAPGPPKPPRRSGQQEPDVRRSQVPELHPEPAASRVPQDYPIDLNPFGEEDEVEDVPPAKVLVSNTVPNIPAGKTKDISGTAPIKSLNPFGDSDEEFAEPSEDVKPKSEAPQRRLIPCDWYNKELNPFSSDSDEDDDKLGKDTSQESSDDVVLRVGHRVQNRQDVSSMFSVIEGGRPIPRKKRVAPKPPASIYVSEDGSKSVSSGSPKSASKPRAPPPPPSPRAEHSRRHSASPVATRKALSPSGPFRRELRDAVPSPGHQSSAWSDASSSSGGPSQTPDSEGSRTTSTAAGTPNTFGAWKKKKRRAPALPLPQRRQLHKLPLKEIEVELQEIEEKQLDLEKQGVELEIAIREKFDDEEDPSPEEEDLVLQLFELVNKKNALFRRQTELVYLKRQHRLEEEHADLEYKIRCLMSKPDHKKTEEDRAEEEQLIARLVNVVTLRSEIIESMEMDRVREAQEDRSIHERLTLHQRSSSLGSLISMPSNESTPKPESKSGKAKVKKEKKKKKLWLNQTNGGGGGSDIAETQSLNRAFNELEKKRRWL